MIILRSLFLGATLCFSLAISSMAQDSPKSLREWCSSQDYGSPQWNLLQILINSDTTPPPYSLKTGRDCPQIIAFLENISQIRLNFNEVSQVSIDFTPLSLLPRLRKLEVINFPKGLLNLRSLNGLNLEKLTLMNLGLENLHFISGITAQELSLEQNPLYGLYGIHRVKGLKALTLSETSVKDLRPLKPLKLERLNIVGLNVPVILGLEYLAQDLLHLDVRNTVLSDHRLLNNMKNLKTLKVTGDNAPLDLSKLRALETLYLKSFNEGDILFPLSFEKMHSLTATKCDLSNINFLHSSQSIQEINFSFNRISDLSPLSLGLFPQLKSLYLTANPILNVYPLKTLSALESLQLFRTPIQRGQVPKTEDNCPTMTGPEVLRKFCVN